MGGFSSSRPLAVKSRVGSTHVHSQGARHDRIHAQFVSLHVGCGDGVAPSSVRRTDGFAIGVLGTGKKYVTETIDIIATLEEGGKPVRKNAKGTIYVSRFNGKCVSLPAKTTK